MNTPKIPRDKLMHGGVGALVALFALLAWALAAAAGLAPLSGAPAAAALSSLVAGLTKEGCDYLDNKQTRTQMHGVELLDVLATALPGFVFGAVAWQFVDA